MAALLPFPSDQNALPANPFGRDEMNLAEFAMTLPGDSAKPGQKTLYFEDKHGRLTVTGSDAYGLPTASDADVIVALLELTKKQNNFTSAKINFTKYELLKMLGWANKGESYKRLDQSFNRWSGVLLIYDKCWWCNKRRKYVSAKMHILDSVVFSEPESCRQDERGELPFSTFTWNQTFIESCQNDNLRELDAETYKSFKSALTKKLYRFLGKRFYRQSDWTFDLKEIAFERVGLSRSYADAGKIKEKLQPALDELEAIGFLEPLDRSERYQKIAKGQWSIRLSQKLPGPLPSLNIEQSEPPSHPIMAELTKRGVTASTAAELLHQHQADAIRLKIEQFDFLVSRNDRKISKSPAGYLVKSIQVDYAAPAGFLSKADQAKREEVKQAKARIAADDRRRKREADAADQAEIAAADAYWLTLSSEEQQRTEQAALALAGDMARETYQLMQNLKAGAGYLAALRRDYLRSLAKCEQQTELA